MPLTGWQQGMPSLMGMSDPRLTVSPSTPSLMSYQPGQWSQLAFQMAGSPNQGPSPSVAVPAGTGASGSSGGGGGGIGGAALGILGAIAKNPSLMNTIGKGVTSLFGDSIPADVVTAANAGAASAVAPIGVSDVSVLPSVQGAIDVAGTGEAAGTAASGAATGGTAEAGSSAATLAPALGGTLAIAGALAPAIIGMSTPAVKVPASYYSSAFKDLQAGPGTPTGYMNNSFGQRQPVYIDGNGMATPQYQAYLSALSELRNDSNAPDSIKQWIAQNGLMNYGAVGGGSAASSPIRR